MALKLRRGTNSARSGFIPAQGELIYTTDTKLVYVGDGTTAGGNALGGGGGGITSVISDTTPTLGGNLTLNSHNIQGTGNINITGNITTVGPLTVGGGQAGILNVNYISGGASAINLKSSNKSAVNIQSFTPDGANTNSVNLSIQVSRGSVASPTPVLAGDVLGGLIIGAYNGTDYKPAGFVTAQLDPGAVLSDAYPASEIGFGSGGGGMVINVAKLDAKGRWKSPRLQITGYATGSYPSSPTEGEIIFDSTTKKFMGYNGTAWVAFTGP
jgi:hypothetical protein